MLYAFSQIEAVISHDSTLTYNLPLITYNSISLTVV